MVEFWVCQVCKSLNRPNAARCYHCRSRRGTRAPDTQGVRKGGGSPGIAGGSSSGTPPAPRPAAAPLPVAAPLPATPRPTVAGAGYFSDRQPAPVEKRRRRLPRVHLGRPRILHVPTRFAPGGYVAAWRFGYATAAVVGASLLVGLLLAAVAAAPIIEAVRDRTADPLQAAFRPGGSAYLLAAVFAVVSATALAMFGVFVGVATRNAPLLGAEAAPLSPVAATRSWPNVLWAQGRLAVLLVVPPILFERGLGIPACLGLLVLIEWMQRHQPSLLDWLSLPGRHLVDLYDRMGLKGVGSLLVRAWRSAFVAANALLVLLWCLPLAIAVTHQVSLFRKEVGPPPAGFSPAQVATLLLVAAFVVALAATIGLLVPITAELSERQRVRRTLVIAGLARPWTNPGQAPTAAGGPATNREPDWDERPATRWSDLGAMDREAWEHSVEAAGPQGRS